MRVFAVIMDVGWTVMATWIDNNDESMVIGPTLTNVSFRLGKGIVRLILVTDVYIAAAADVIPNMDADESGESPETITGFKTEMGKLSAAAISGYGPYANRGMA